MPLYLIGYDVDSSKIDYDIVNDAIKDIDQNAWGKIDSTRIIRYNGAAKDIVEILLPVIGESGKLLVVRIYEHDSSIFGFSGDPLTWLMSNLHPS